MAAATPSKGATAAALADGIAAAVEARIKPEFAKIGEQLAMLKVTVEAVTARLAILENATGAPAAPKATAKRAVARAPAKAKAPAPVAPGGVKLPVNSRLYWRQEYMKNAPWVTKYYTQGELATASGGASALRPGKSPEEVRGAVALALWGTMTPATREAIKKEFEKVTTAAKAAAGAGGAAPANPQLEEDMATGADVDADADAGAPADSVGVDFDTGV